jgi:hypothetical protein
MTSHSKQASRAGLRGRSNMHTNRYVGEMRKCGQPRFGMVLLKGEASSPTVTLVDKALALSSCK